MTNTAIRSIDRPPLISGNISRPSATQTAPAGRHASLPKHLLLVSEATGDYVTLLKWPWISHQDRVPMKYLGPLHDTSPVLPLSPVRFPYALLPSWDTTCISCNKLHALSNGKWQIAGPLNLFGFGWNLFRRVSSAKGTGATMWIKFSSTSPIHHTTVKHPRTHILVRIEWIYFWFCRDRNRRYWKKEFSIVIYYLFNNHLFTNKHIHIHTYTYILLYPWVYVHVSMHCMHAYPQNYTHTPHMTRTTFK